MSFFSKSYVITTLEFHKSWFSCDVSVRKQRVVVD